MISKSYPYLSIAKKHGVDYALVLDVADFVTRRSGNVEQALCVSGIIAYYGKEFERDIAEAADYFRGVRSGVIPFQ